MTAGHTPNFKANDKQNALRQYKHELHDHLTNVQKRCERLERGQGIGHCRECQHWRRERNCAWGYCGLTEGVPAADWPWRGEPGQVIVTKENFGCIWYTVRQEPVLMNDDAVVWDMLDGQDV